MNPFFKFLILFSIVALALQCGTTPKPVRLQGNETVEQRRQIYKQNKLQQESALSAPKVNGELVADADEIMHAEYSSQKTRDLWSSRNTYMYIGFPFAFGGGFMIGYGASSSNSAVLGGGIGVAAVGLIFGFIADSYAFDAGKSYNDDLKFYLQLENVGEVSYLQFSSRF